MPRLSDLLSEKMKSALKTAAPAPKSVRQEKPVRPASPEPDKRKIPPQSNYIIPDFVAVDVETTGLDFAHDRIIEVGAVKFHNGFLPL
jgi:DNA polymerase III epsilon subunit-like protein